MRQETCLRSSRCLLGAYVALSALLCGCSASRLPAYGSVPALESDRQFVQEWSLTYPDAFKMVQRIVLVVGEKQYDFVGYLLMRRPATFRALGMGEMGGRIFDLEALDGQFQIVRKPEAMPPRPILEGVIGDILFLFGGAPAVDWKAALGENGERVIVWNLGGERAYECELEAGKTQPGNYRERQGGRIVREAVFSKWQVLPGCEKPIPGHIVIENRRWGYKMEIEQLQCEPVQALKPGEAPPEQKQPSRIGRPLPGRKP